MFKDQIRPAIFLFLILTVITGIVYPLMVTGIAQALFHEKANGSILYIHSHPAGSSLIGQSFDDAKYFWGRLSATSPEPYNAAASSGSNLGPSNPALLAMVKLRIKALQDTDPGNKKLIPVDLVTSSASGLDPHISVASAYYQISRVARGRGVSEEAIERIVNAHTRGRFIGILGEPVVNVLELNVALDAFVSREAAKAQLR
jgi:K+-transporting ATPase ATPase C chain